MARMGRFTSLWFFLLTAAAVSAGGGQTEHEPLVGNPLGLPAIDTPGQPFAPISPNVKVFGSIVSAESCSYDAKRGHIVVPNRGNIQTVQANDGYISLLNSDGSVHTLRWLGYQTPEQRELMSKPFVLNHPNGSDIVNDAIYVADRDGGTSPDDPSHAVIRWYDLATGVQLGEEHVPESIWINDIAVTKDGVIYATQSGDLSRNPDKSTWHFWKIEPGKKPKLLVQGALLDAPNGIALDNDGNLAIVNMRSTDILIFSPQGKLLRRESTLQTGNDGLVILPDGTRYVSSARQGGITEIAPGKAPRLIAENLPLAASMCYDSGAKQLVVPMNAYNSLVFVPLDQ